MASGNVKRIVWSEGEIVSLVREIIANHDLFMIKKRLRLCGEFWTEIGKILNKPADSCEKLMRNLSAEYQKVQMSCRVSGSGTETLTIRASERIYSAFDEYYSLYFPHGGSTRPAFVLTAAELVTFQPSSTTAGSSSNAASSPATAGSSSNASSSSNAGSSSATAGLSLSAGAPSAIMDMQQSAASTSYSQQSATSAPARRVKRLGRTNITLTTSTANGRPISSSKFKSTGPKITNSSYLRQQLSLQTRALNIERQKLKALNNMSNTVNQLACDVKLLQQAFFAVHNVEVADKEQ